MGPHGVLRDSPRFADLIGTTAASLPSEMPSKPSPLDIANQTIRDLKNQLHKERTSPERQALLEEKHRLQQERDAAVQRTESAARELAAYAMAFSSLVSLWHVIGSGKE